jgi:hypothetical protein
MVGARTNNGTSYERDIKPLFRAKDRNSMIGHFDLWLYRDVKSNADAIYGEVSAGSMPCDAAWPAERVAKFKEWMDDGMPA